MARFGPGSAKFGRSRPTEVYQNLIRVRPSVSASVSARPSVAAEWQNLTGTPLGAPRRAVGRWPGACSLRPNWSDNRARVHCGRPPLRLARPHERQGPLHRFDQCRSDVEPNLKMPADFGRTLFDCERFQDELAGCRPNNGPDPTRSKSCRLWRTSSGCGTRRDNRRTLGRTTIHGGQPLHHAGLLRHEARAASRNRTSKTWPGPPGIGLVRNDVGQMGTRTERLLWMGVNPKGNRGWERTSRVVQR